MPEKAVGDTRGIPVTAHDLPAGVDAISLGAAPRNMYRIGVIDGAVLALAQQESVGDARAPNVGPDHGLLLVDAKCECALVNVNAADVAW